mmetsp:Transcript_33775/g.34047  ORF Transcript_33775/g.34047 Transcript_33775/m.34047 type:complete len:101 (+) Transcript_33775:729-1031(+)
MSHLTNYSTILVMKMTSYMVVLQRFFWGNLLFWFIMIHQSPTTLANHQNPKHLTEKLANTFSWFVRRAIQINSSLLLSSNSQLNSGSSKSNIFSLKDYQM